MAKLRGYQTVFSVKNQSLSEAQELYNLLMKSLTFSQKDNFEITISDPIGGKHFVFDNSGVAPNGETCKKCYNIDCRKCKIFYQIEERAEKEKEKNREIEI